MKKITALLILLATISGLISCGGSSDVPDGMQLIDGSEAQGFYFYGPEGWVVSNYGNISGAYASSVDYNTTVTYTETTLPDGIAAQNDFTLGAAKTYFESSLSEFPEGLKPKNVVWPTETGFIFGNADVAFDFTYEITYPDENPDDDVDSSFTYKFLQIFAVYENRFGIFTFTSTLNKIGDVTRFDYHKERLKKITDNFKFVEKSGEDAKLPEYSKGEDGYMLVSNKGVCGFSLYVPNESTVEFSSGLVSVKLSEGANLTLSKSTDTSVSVGNYIKGRMESLKKHVSDFEDLTGDKPKATAIGNLVRDNEAVMCEYTYVYNGEKYHVYQVYCVTYLIYPILPKDGFVFTYTAKEADYEKNLDTVMEIAKRVVF